MLAKRAGRPGMPPGTGPVEPATGNQPKARRYRVIEHHTDGVRNVSDAYPRRTPEYTPADIVVFHAIILPFVLLVLGIVAAVLWIVA